MAREGMVISLGGVLERAAEAADASTSFGYGFMLRELHKHLEEFRQRHKAGDEGVADEFFDLYVE